MSIYKNLCLFIILAVFSGCGNGELTIEPISDYDDGCENFQYYEISNYKHIAPDSLYVILNEYVNSRYPYEGHLERLRKNHRCDFAARFYEQSLFANYKENLIYDPHRNEMGFIDKYRDKLTAIIFITENMVFHTVIYDKNGILWKKDDSVY